MVNLVQFFEMIDGYYHNGRGPGKVRQLPSLPKPKFSPESTASSHDAYFKYTREKLNNLETNFNALQSTLNYFSQKQIISTKTE